MVDQLKALIQESRKMVIFTGAGISTESGIPDFRSQGGLWDRYQPVVFSDFLAFEDKREEYWRQKLELYEQFGHAKPNPAHHAVTRLNEKGNVNGLITQNIDGLHQLSGFPPERIIEIHGSNRETLCLGCGDLKPWKDVYKRLKSGERAPRCLICRDLLKPNTISFGQTLNAGVLKAAWRLAHDCDLFLVIGSTLVVEPAASLPLEAKNSGSKLAIVNLSDTPLDHLADLVMRGKAGEVMSRVI